MGVTHETINLKSILYYYRAIKDKTFKMAKGFGSPMNCHTCNMVKIPKSCIVSRVQNHSHPLGF